MNEEWWERLGFAVAIAFIVYVSTVLVAWYRVDGHVDYCLINEVTDAPRPYYTLWGHRSWVSDLRIGTFESIDGASDAAVKLGCPLNRSSR